MLYINGRPVNPIVSFLVSAAVIAGMIGLGILLLPVIGGIMIFILFCVAAIALYGAYYRWRHGDPFKKAQEEMLRRMQGMSAAQSTQSVRPGQPEPEVPQGKARTGVRRTTVIEDAVVVEETRRRDASEN